MAWSPVPIFSRRSQSYDQDGNVGDVYFKGGPARRGCRSRFPAVCLRYAKPPAATLLTGLAVANGFRGSRYSWYAFCVRDACAYISLIFIAGNCRVIVEVIQIRCIRACRIAQPKRLSRQRLPSAERRGDGPASVRDGPLPDSREARATPDRPICERPPFPFFPSSFAATLP